MGSDIKLKPCPFCGGEVMLYTNHYLGSMFHYVACYKCDATVETVHHKDKEFVIKTWNTRKPMDKVVEQLREENKTAVGAAIIFDGDYYNGLVDGLEKAIEIVRGGV